MTAQKLFQEQLADAGYQISKVLEGMPEAAMDHKTTPGAMSPREQLGHLMEAYEAFIEQSAGRKFEWNTFKPKSHKTADLIEEFMAQRQRAVNAALANDSDDHLITAHKYLLGHDYYHVGQLCLARLAVDPNWDPYAIYQM